MKHKAIKFYSSEDILICILERDNSKIFYIAFMNDKFRSLGYLGNIVLSRITIRISSVFYPQFNNKLNDLFLAGCDKHKDSIDLPIEDKLKCLFNQRKYKLNEKK